MAFVYNFTCHMYVEKRRKCKTLIGNLRNPETIKGYAASAISSNNAMTILVLLYVDRRLKIGYFFLQILCWKYFPPVSNLLKNSWRSLSSFFSYELVARNEFVKQFNISWNSTRPPLVIVISPEMSHELCISKQSSCFSSLDLWKYANYSLRGQPHFNCHLSP